MTIRSQRKFGHVPHSLLCVDCPPLIVTTDGQWTESWFDDTLICPNYEHMLGCLEIELEIEKGAACNGAHCGPMLDAPARLPKNAPTHLYRAWLPLAFRGHWSQIGPNLEWCPSSA